MEGRRRHRGFTIIELVTVMVVLAILAVAVGGPTLAHVSAMRSRIAATRIASDLSWIQRLAMNSRRRTWALFDVPNNRYTLYVESLTTPGKASRELLAHPLTGATGATQLGSGEFSGSSLASASFNASGEVEFDSLGMPRDSAAALLTANGTITLNNGVTLTVRPVTGLVEQN